jgi:hypothetical protein
MSRDMEKKRRFGTRSEDEAVQDCWASVTNINGPCDPLHLSVVMRFRSLSRYGTTLESTMDGRCPRPWKGLMDWVLHADKGETTADASRRGIAEPTVSQLQDWEGLNRYAHAELTIISVCLNKYGVKETIMMRDRRDAVLTQRTGAEELALSQETFYILSKLTGGHEEAEQALLRLPIWSRHLLMTPSTALDVCLVQVEEGNVNHFCSPEDSEWGFRARAVVNYVLSSFNETRYGYLPEILYNPNLRHLSVDVTKTPETETARAQARTAAQTVFGEAGVLDLLKTMKRLPEHLREKMVTPLARVAQLQEAVQVRTLEEEAVPEDSQWCRYVEFLAEHILDLPSACSRRTLRDGSTTDHAHTTLSELWDLYRKITQEMPQRCATAEGALKCMRPIVPATWSLADIFRGCYARIQAGTLPHSAASDFSWDIRMMEMKNFTGQLKGVMKFREARIQQFRAGQELAVFVPLLRHGGSPSYSSAVRETPTETSLRGGIAPPHGTVISLWRGLREQTGPSRAHDV